VADINDNRWFPGRAAPLAFKAEALCLEGAGYRSRWLRLVHLSPDQVYWRIETA